MHNGVACIYGTQPREKIPRNFLIDTVGYRGGEILQNFIHQGTLFVKEPIIFMMALGKAIV